jgi:hypothetical protein
LSAAEPQNRFFGKEKCGGGAPDLTYLRHYSFGDQNSDAVYPMQNCWNFCLEYTRGYSLTKYSRSVASENQNDLDFQIMKEKSNEKSQSKSLRSKEMIFCRQSCLLLQFVEIGASRVEL